MATEEEKTSVSRLERPFLFAQEMVRIVPQHIWTPEHVRYGGSAMEISEAIVRDRWNGVYFEAGESPINQFWPRDFGLALRGIKEAGMEDEAQQSLRWALGQYERFGRLSTTIAPNGLPFDVYRYGADTLPWTLYALKELDDQESLDRHGNFLQKQVDLYAQRLFDPHTNGVKLDKHFPALKDMITRRGTAVANAFLLMTHQLLGEDFNGALDNPFRGRDMEGAFMDTFWNGSYFIENCIDEKPRLAGDAAIIPFAIGVVDDDAMLSSTFTTIRREGLDLPFFLRYHKPEDHSERDAEHIARVLAPNFQGTTVWPMLGPDCIRLARRVDPDYANEQQRAYESWIERLGTYVEVFEPDGETPYRGRQIVYHGAHSGMLWAAGMLELGEMPEPVQVAQVRTSESLPTMSTTRAE